MEIGGNPYRRKNYQRTRTHILEKYDSPSIYDIDFEKKYFVDNDDIHFVKGYGYALVENPYGTSTDHGYFFICDDLFDRIVETYQNSYIVLKVINKDVSLP